MAKPPVPIETGTVLDAATPNPHTQYSVVFLNEQNNRLHAFMSGIDALESEKVSRVTAFEALREKRRAEFEAAEQSADRDHVDEVGELNRRIADLATGADMAKAAVDMYDRHQAATGKEGDAT